MTQLDVLGIIRAAQQLERNASIALMYSGLPISQYRLLEWVDRCEDPTVTEVGKQLNITRASASVMVNELSRSGILYLEDNPTDRCSFTYGSAPGTNLICPQRSRGVSPEDFGTFHWRPSRL